MSTKNKYTIYPIQYPSLWEMYKKAQECNWSAEELDLTADKEDWDKLNSKEQHFIKMVLAFFAASDGIVAENLVNRFSDEIDITEAKAFYAFQNYMETVHSEVYSLLIMNYISDPEEQSDLLNAVDNYPCIKKKADWALRWIDSSAPFTQRLIAFAVVEGIFFSGSFCAIFWLKSRNIMVTGLGTSNEYISRDEGMHTDFAIMLYKHLDDKVEQSVAHSIISDAVEIEKEFITEAIPCTLIGMNSDLMVQYIEYVADRLSQQLGFEAIYNVENPFTFMERLGMESKTNFFEKRNTEYRMASGQSAVEKKFTLDDDF